MIFNGKKAQEKGSIMLEVIAVLALMGVMGAMLFRQIYLRNQELHNVQMASEMRTVKEAFSAALQARAQEVLSHCTIPDTSSAGVKMCDESKRENERYPNKASGFPVYVKQYLPDGWFASSAGGDSEVAELMKYYSFYIFIYKQEDSSQKVKMYGMVVPNEPTLPATGWNFKRAARVALLIGADGGAYGPGITKEGESEIIAGSLGTWSLLKSGITTPQRSSADIPTYVAITGLDVFTPEYDVPDVTLTLPEQWDLQLQKVNVYNTFTVGNNASNCVGTINHDETSSTDGVYTGKSDQILTVGSDCLPSFWVDAGTTDQGGQVYTRNDLNVGYDETDPDGNAPAIKLRKDGVIVFSKKYKDGQDSAEADEKPYMLDPAYTSVMNDIKLTSRGGARLSDILPTYILKTQEEISNQSSSAGAEVDKPTCPKGYKKALVILPTTWGAKELSVSVGKLNIKTDHFKTKSDTVTAIQNTSGKYEVTIPQLEPIDDATTEEGTGSTVAPGVCVKISGSSTPSFNEVDENSTEKWTVILGSRNGANCSIDTDVKAIAQTYCVYDSASFTTIDDDFSDRTGLTQAECSKIGGKFDATKQTCKLP